MKMARHICKKSTICTSGLNYYVCLHAGCIAIYMSGSCSFVVVVFIVAAYPRC